MGWKSVEPPLFGKIRRVREVVHFCSSHYSRCIEIRVFHSTIMAESCPVRSRSVVPFTRVVHTCESWGTVTCPYLWNWTRSQSNLGVWETWCSAKWLDLSNNKTTLHPLSNWKNTYQHDRQASIDEDRMLDTLRMAFKSQIICLILAYYKHSKYIT